MLGPSGFFLPSGPENADSASNDLELIHTSKDGFNELYRICKSGRFFVYKALKKEYRGNPMYEDLLTKDFNIGFSLTHPGLCQYFAKISHPEIGNCIVMEWIDGCTLEELIATGDVDKSLAEKIICEICDALGYMHRRQVIHRDLKPENIMLNSQGAPAWGGLSPVEGRGLGPDPLTFSLRPHQTDGLWPLQGVDPRGRCDPHLLRHHRVHVSGSRLGPGAGSTVR